MDELLELCDLASTRYFLLQSQEHQDYIKSVRDKFEEVSRIILKTVRCCAYKYPNIVWSDYVL